MTEQKNKEIVMKGIIMCPHCHTQYSPSEIFIPGQLLGKPENIIKDPTGHILYTEWNEEPEEVEHFICEECGRSFVIEASMTFKTHAEDETEDFTNLSSSII